MTDQIKSRYAITLNALSEMQESTQYALRKSVLQAAETAIVALEAKESELQATMTGIRAAITNYYLDLDARKHGGVAQDLAFSKIERIMEMNWSDHKAAVASTAASTKKE